MLPYSGLNCSRRARPSIANPSVRTDLLAFKNCYSENTKSRCEEVNFACLRSFVAKPADIPPGNHAGGDCGTFNLHFQGEKPAGTLPGPSALPCHRGTSLILLTPLPVQHSQNPHALLNLHRLFGNMDPMNSMGCFLNIEEEAHL